MLALLVTHISALNAIVLQQDLDKNRLAAQPNHATNIPQILSDARDDVEHGTGFAFRSWTYLRLWISPDPENPEQKQDICADTGCSITMADKIWLAKFYPHRPFFARKSHSQ